MIRFAPNPPAAEPPGNATEVQLRDCVFVVLRRRWLIASAIALGIALAATVSILQEPRYNATALIQITQARINLSQSETIEEAKTKSEEFYATQNGILKSRMLAERVMNDLRLWEHPLFLPEEPNARLSPEQLRQKQTDELGKMLRVSHIEGTQLVRIHYSAPDPKLAADLANTLARQYISYSAETASGLARDASSFIRDQIEKLQQEIEVNEARLSELSQRDDVVLLDQQEDMTARQLEDLNSELTSIQAERATAEAEYLSLQRTSPENVPAIQENRIIQDLKKQQSELQNRLADLLNKFKPGYPEVERTRKSIESVQMELDRELTRAGETALAAAKIRYETALDRERILRRTLERERQQTRELSKMTRDYERIRMELENQRAVQQQLMQRQSETGLSAEMGERTSPMTARLVDAAVVPTKRSSPNHRVNLLIGGTVGLIAGFGLAFFVSYWDQSLQSEADVRRYLDLPVLGLIPHDPARGESRTEFAALPPGAPPIDAETGQVEGEVGHADGGGNGALVPRVAELALTPSYSSPLMGERFKFLRSSLLLSTPQAPPKTVLVTSSTESEGKSFVASHLAACLAELGKKVLLVDADLRRPVMDEVFRAENGKGLTSLLTGQNPGGSPGTSAANGGLEELAGIGRKTREKMRALGFDSLRSIVESPERLTDVPGIGARTARKIVAEARTILGREDTSDVSSCVRATSIQNLFVVMAGPRSPAPAELLSSSAMVDVIKRFSEEYDFVVLDSAPLLPVVDSHALTRSCDAVVLVVRAGATPRHAVASSKSLVLQNAGKINGVVLNDVDLNDLAQRHLYGYGEYEYGERSGESATGEVGS